MRRLAKISGPPFDPYKYASALGIEIEETEGMTLDGTLKQINHDKFAIRLRKESLETRKRFTVAHEIGHTFFYDILARSESFRGSDHFDAEEERLCDIAAAELLMPFSIFQNDLRSRQDDDKTIPPTALFWLKNRYQVSLQAVAIRVAWVSRDIACSLWKQNGHAMNLEWITPQTLRNLVLCQTGKSSVEMASAQIKELFKGTDTFYQAGESKMIRRTASFGFRSGQVLSVINLRKTSNKRT